MLFAFQQTAGGGEVCLLLALCNSSLEINTPHKDFWARLTQFFRLQRTEKHA